MKLFTAIFTAVVILIVSGCASPKKLVLSPDDRVYCIDTRIVFLNPQYTQQEIDETMWALLASESCFREFRVKFQVTSITTYDLPSRGADFESMSAESICYPSQLNIYIWPESKWLFGMSRIPSSQKDSIVALYGEMGRTPSILVHELGHWMGLMHSFDCDPSITDIDHVQAEKDGVFDKNFMGYGFAIDWWDKSFTCQQYDKMIFTLATARKNCMLNYEKSPANKGH